MSVDTKYFELNKKYNELEEYCKILEKTAKQLIDSAIYSASERAANVAVKYVIDENVKKLIQQDIMKIPSEMKTMQIVMEDK